MTAVTIEQGSKVKVELEGEVVRSDKYGHVLKRSNGEQHYVPADAKVTVTEKPLPAEPPVGAIVTDNYGCCIFKRFYPGEWYRLNDSSTSQPAGKKLTWREVVKTVSENGAIKYLVEDPTRNETASLKKKTLETTDTRQSKTVTVEWDTYEWSDGRVRFRDNNSGSEILRLNPEGARKVAKAILATVGN